MCGLLVCVQCEQADTRLLLLKLSSFSMFAVVTIRTARQATMDITMSKSIAVASLKSQICTHMSTFT